MCFFQRGGDQTVEDFGNAATAVSFFLARGFVVDAKAAALAEAAHGRSITGARGNEIPVDDVCLIQSGL